MATPIIMPRQGQSVESCIISELFVKKGDTVKEGDRLFSYETDKAAFEEESRASGEVLEIFFKEGDDVPVLTNVCVIGEAGEDCSKFAPGGVLSEPKQEEPQNKKLLQNVTVQSQQQEIPLVSGNGFVSPRAKNLADKTGADIRFAIPTGPNGRIIERDVRFLQQKGYLVTAGAKEGYTSLEHLMEGSGLSGRVTTKDLQSGANEAITKEEKATEEGKQIYENNTTKESKPSEVSRPTEESKKVDVSKKADISMTVEEGKLNKESKLNEKSKPNNEGKPDEENKLTEESKLTEANATLDEQVAAEYQEVKLSNIRKVIARTMHESLSQMAQLTLNVSFDATEIIKFRQQLKNGAEKLGLSNITLNDILIYAVSRILPQHKVVNAHFLGDTIRYFTNVNMGIAVDTERGLMVPTLMNANLKSLNEIAIEAKELAKGCQKGTINPDKLKYGTFTITNLGTLGIESFTPVINPPQTAILGVNTIIQKIRDANGVLEAYSSMPLSLTFDHRVVDGAPAARFLKDLKEALESLAIFLAK